MAWSIWERLGVAASKTTRSDKAVEDWLVAMERVVQRADDNRINASFGQIHMDMHTSA